jgi:hypothetical protein
MVKTRPWDFGDSLLEDTVLGEGATAVEDPAKSIGGDLIMACHRDLSAFCKSYEVLDLAKALQKVRVKNVSCVIYTCHSVL